MFFQVDKSIGRWILESVRTYNPLSGVTTNQSKGFNTALKQYQRWKEVPVDSLVHGLHCLQQYYHNEIQQGYCGLGSYRLRPKFSSLQQASGELLLLQPVSTPEEILPVFAIFCSYEESEIDLALSEDYNMDCKDVLPADSSQMSRAR